MSKCESCSLRARRRRWQIRRHNGRWPRPAIAPKRPSLAARQAEDRGSCTTRRRRGPGRHRRGSGRTGPARRRRAKDKLAHPGEIGSGRAQDRQVEAPGAFCAGNPGGGPAGPQPPTHRGVPRGSLRRCGGLHFAAEAINAFAAGAVALRSIHPSRYADFADHLTFRLRQNLIEARQFLDEQGEVARAARRRTCSADCHRTTPTADAASRPDASPDPIGDHLPVVRRRRRASVAQM